MTIPPTTSETMVLPASVPERREPPARRLGGVDGLRGLAAIIVVIFHAYGASGGPELRLWHRINILRPLTDGWAAVNLFLVLSGFCLFWPFAVRPNKPLRQIRLRDYAGRRTLRILPTYYASLAFVMLAGFIIPFGRGEPHCFPGSVGDLILHVLLLNAWAGKSMTSWNSPTWSLSVEWTWYFAFPIALIMFRRFGAARGMLVMAGVTIAYRVGLYLIMGPANQYPVNVGWAWRTFLPGRLFEFGVGMAVAAIAAKGMQPSRWTRATVVGVLILALVAARMAEPVDTFLPVRDMLYGTASAALLFMVVIPQGGVIKWISEHIVLVWLGEFSYTLYLFHLTFISAIAMYLKAYGFQGLPLFGMSLLLLPITLAACWGLYFFVERPFLVRRPAPTVSPAVVTVALT